MRLKCGNVVTHTGVHAWGAGKVLEIAAFNATIQFSDGITRKIASSHFELLEPADPAAYVATEVSCEPVTRVVIPRARRKKVVSPASEAC